MFFQKVQISIKKKYKKKFTKERIPAFSEVFDLFFKGTQGKHRSYQPR
jgi:hypothetical protein